MAVFGICEIDGQSLLICDIDAIIAYVEGFTRALYIIFIIIWEVINKMVLVKLMIMQ